MRSRIITASLMVVFMTCVHTSFAGKSSELADQLREALTPSSSGRVAAPSKKRTRAISGIVSDGTGEAKPSVTMQLEFKFNSDELTPQTIKYLDALGTALQDDVLRGFVYKVEGHTDGIGGDSYNLELSRRRAEAVVDYMVETFDLQDEQFEIEGLGKSRPVASNDTEQGRKQNRRVVVINTLKPCSVTVRERPNILVKVKYNASGEQVELMEGEALTQNDTYAIELTPQTSAYVYVYQVDTKGNAVPLYPNARFSPSGNPVEPGRLYRIPHFGRWLSLDASKGVEHIVVVAKRTEVKDPLRMCQDEVKRDKEMLAFSFPVREGTGKRRTLTRSFQGVRPDRPVAEVAPPNPEKQTPGTEVPEETGNAMKGVFFWKRSFMHE